MFYTTTAQVSHADASTETTDLTNFKSMTANAETMTEPTTIFYWINIDYEPELLVPTVISDNSFPQMQSIFATVSTDDFIPPVQK